MSLNADSVAVDSRNGFTLINDKPFTGTLYSLYSPKDTMELRSYVNGKEEGEWKQFYPSKVLKEVRYFKEGKKEGKYLGWWPDGSKQLDYSFKNGEYEGICREWASNGTLIREMHYKAGHEDGAQKTWWANGKVRSNYVIVEGRQYGLVGTKNCKTVEEDSILQKIRM